MELKKIIKRALNEALGVPDNILNVANTIFDELISKIRTVESIDDLESSTINVNGDFHISDLTFNRVKFHIKCNDVSQFDIPNKENLIVDLAGLEVQGGAELTKNLTIKSKNLLGKPVDITLRFVISNKTTVEDIKDFMINKKSQLVGSFAHELKHQYDNHKGPEKNLKSRVRYNVHSGNGFGEITPLNEFIHDIYFVHSIESLVRPSEVAAIMDVNKITQKNFYDFITNDKTYKKLKEIHNFSYDNLKDKLRIYVPQIKKMFKRAGMESSEYENNTDDQIIEKMLGLVYININNWSMEEMGNRLSGNPMAGLLRMLSGESNYDKDEDERRQAYFQKYQKEILKYKDNTRAYFAHEEKIFKFVSERMMKKLAKLYAMARTEQNESITNPDLWYRYIVKEVKIEKNFNFDKKLPKKTKK